MSKKFLSKILGLDLGPKWEGWLGDGSYAIIRVGVALTMLFSHGWGKLMGFSNMAPHFPDPLGIGSVFSLFLVTGAEFFGAILLALGLLSRWASFSLLFTMLVVIFIFHWPDPFKEKELAVLYAFCFLLFTASGGGKYSLDSLLKKKF